LKKRKEQSALINKKIRSPQVQLITHEGKNIGVVDTLRALQMAGEVSLDLVVISGSGKEGVPVAKITDFGKELYEEKKKLTAAKKNQKVIQIKEIKLRPCIGDHDYNTKMKKAIDFLNTGKRVKVTLFFRGRENITKVERGHTLFARVENTFNEYGLGDTLVQDNDSKMGQFWSRIFYLKGK
jgi:translation initiation factor IF-3